MLSVQKSCKYIFVGIVLMCCGLTSKAYSILAHEAIIDAAWANSLRPMLKEKYPDATDLELRTAHSYAYGGSIVADMGYMPFGNGFFTDLVHYVRSGDFVEALVKDASNLNEYAFALGALSHYMADKYGHSMSTNRNVPLVYPNLKKKFGNVVTYDNDHTSHSRIEFAYDVIQIGQGNYTTEGYHDFIGFNISVPVLERAFYETYGQQLGTIFGNINSSINTMRWGVRSLFPNLTKSAYKANQVEIEKLHPGITVKKFRYKMSRKSFNLEYGKEHQEPKFFTKVAVFMIKILPKIGPLKKLSFKSPGEQGQKLFAVAFETIETNYRTALKQAGQNRLVLPDIDFDTGNPVRFNEYPLVNKTYDKLVEVLQQNNYKNVTPQLKKDIVNFYNTADTTQYATKDAKKWNKTSMGLRRLAQFRPVAQDSLVSLVQVR
jgi:hypothetical protein